MPKNRLIAIEKQLVARDKHRQFLTSPHRDPDVENTESQLTALLVEHRTLKRLLPGNSSSWVPGVPHDPRFTVDIDENDKMCLTANLSCPSALLARRDEYKRSGGYVYEPRYDGMLLRLTYNKRGVLSSACTQGDGLNGQDVLHRVRMMENLPTKVCGEQVSVTGVVVCRQEDYESYCEHFSLDDTTPSHLVTYLMRKESDVDTTQEEDNEDALPLYFIAFHTSQAIRKRCKTYDKLKTWLSRQGFIVPDSADFCPDGLTWDGPYPSNGVILKQTDLSCWETHPAHIWYNWVVGLRRNTTIQRRFLKDVFWYFDSEARGPDNGVLMAKGVCIADSRTMQETETFLLRHPTLYRKAKLAMGDIVEVDTQRKEIIGYLSLGFGHLIEVPKTCHYCDTPLTVTGPHRLACENVGHCPSHWSVRSKKTFSTEGLNLWPKGKITDLGEHMPGSLVELMALLNKPILDGAENQAVRHVQKTLRERTKTGFVANWLYATGLHGLSLSRCYVLEEALCDTRHPLSAPFVVNWLSQPDNLQTLFGLDSLDILSDAVSQRETLLTFLAYCPWPNEQQQTERQLPLLVAISDEISAKHYTLTQRMTGLGWCVDNTLTKKTACYLTGIGGSSSHRQLAKRYGIPVIETESLSIDDILNYVEAKHVF